MGIVRGVELSQLPPLLEAAIAAGLETPVFAAWHAGASMVKVFPASSFGPSYFRELKGPFADISLLACGGVTAQNLGEYARHGADAFAFGAGVFAHSRIRAGKYAQIESEIRALVAALPDSPS